MKALVFHPQALAEFEEQALFCERRSPGLGARFASEVEAAVRRALSMPGIRSLYRHGTRRVFPGSFPHSIVYREAADSLEVLAVAPFKRKPGYRRSRA